MDGVALPGSTADFAKLIVEETVRRGRPVCWKAN
jgi:hypothetical protein